MPAPPWATPDQLEFLISRIPDFQTAQREKKTNAFWGIMTRNFFKHWPDQESEKMLAIPSKGKRRKEKRRTMPATEPKTLTEKEWLDLRTEVRLNKTSFKLVWIFTICSKS